MCAARSISRRSVSIIGGTYIPLQGLNGAFGAIPLLGQILSGTQGEGIFGITFAVQGPTSDPQVIVNPLSLVAPGIFREMFQMTASIRKFRCAAMIGYRSSRRDKAGASPPRAASQGDKSKTKSKSKSKSKKPPGAQAEAIDGWSSTTSPPPH